MTVHTPLHSAIVFRSLHKDPGRLHEVHVGSEQQLAFNYSFFEPTNSPAGRYVYWYQAPYTQGTNKLYTLDVLGSPIRANGKAAHILASSGVDANLSLTLGWCTPLTNIRVLNRIAIKYSDVRIICRHM
jgi:hypothetical protein